MCSRVLSVRMFHFRKRPGWPLVVACKLLLTGGVCPPEDTIYTMRLVNRFPSVGLWIRYVTAGAQPAAVGLYNFGPNQTKRGLGPAGKFFFAASPARACHVHNTSYMHLCVPPAAVIQRMRLKPLHNPTLCVCRHISWQTGYFSDVYRVVGTSEARVLLYAESRRVSHSLETIYKILWIRRASLLEQKRNKRWTSSQSHTKESAYLHHETASYYGFGNVPGSFLSIGWLGFKGSKARFQG